MRDKFPGSELIDLSFNGSEASLLVIRKYATHDGLFNELTNLQWDKRCLMYGRVVNKHARWNLVFADESQEPNYESGKGRVVKWSDVPLLNSVKERVESDFSRKVVGEGNYYYNNKCGIGYHGDKERKFVIGLRLGATIPLCFRWYHKGQLASDTATIALNHGDLYIMSEKAVGSDWNRPSILTMRHAAGSDKYVK